MLLGGCVTDGTLTAPSSEATCAAIKHSPSYSGKKLRQAAGEKFRQWTAETNLTLDRLGCEK